MRALRETTPLHLVSPSVDADDPATLVAAIKRGDQVAAAKLWRKYRGLVFQTLRRMLGPDQDVGDLAQEAFLRFFSSVDRIRDLNLIVSFLQGIAIHVAQKELRRRKSRNWLRLTPTGAIESPPVETSDHGAKESLRRFFSLLDLLDIESRTVFILRHVEHHELQDIANLASLSLSTVKRRLERAEQRMTFHIGRDEALMDYVSKSGSWLDSQGSPET